MPGDKLEISDTDALTSSAPMAKPSLGSRIGAHLKKWWWVYGIIVVVVVLVVVPPVVFVGYPNFAQTDVNKSTLNITSMTISNPAPDSFHLNQTQVLGSKSSFHPTIYAFSAAVSLLGATYAPFGHVQVPRVKADDGAVVQIDQQVKLSDESAFGDFAKAVLLNKGFELNVYGRPELRQGGLRKIEVGYNKTVSMKGLNKLEGFDITQFSLLSKDEPDGTNTKGTVYIPNPTVMTITMGNLTLDLSSNNTHIGQSYLHNLVLHPGNNTIPMTAQVDKMAVIGLLPSDAVLPVDIRGNASVYHGQELPYFSEALAANVLHARLDLGKALLGGI